jgi:glycosyltransferase involved in cell wall biosynthesis
MADRAIISVITVVFNAVKTVEETILSVIGQTSDHFEYIILDGGSTDGTVEIIKKYAEQITYWKSEADHGIYDAMNKSLAHTNGKFTFFLGADDTFVDNNVLSNVELYLKDPNTVYYGDVIFKNRNQTYDGEFTAWKMVTRNISHQSIFYPAQILNRYKFDLRYKVYADYHLNLLLFSNKAFRFTYIPLTIAVFNDHGTSGSNAIDRNFEDDMLKIVKSHFPWYIYSYRLARTVIGNLLGK